MPIWKAFHFHSHKHTAVWLITASYWRYSTSIPELLHCEPRFLWGDPCSRRVFAGLCGPCASLQELWRRRLCLLYAVQPGLCNGPCWASAVGATRSTSLPWNILDLYLRLSLQSPHLRSLFEFEGSGEQVFREASGDRFYAWKMFALH